MSRPSGAIDMTQGKPINLMLRFALPMMIGSIFQSLYSMVDSAVLGRFVGSLRAARGPPSVPPRPQRASSCCLQPA